MITGKLEENRHCSTFITLNWFLRSGSWSSSRRVVWKEKIYEIWKSPETWKATITNQENDTAPFYQCCGSGMFIPDPGSRIPDPGSKNSNKREMWKKISCHTFLCSHKFHKIVNYFSFEVLKKKIWANFQKIIELFTKKIVKKLLKIWSWDPGSGIRKKPIPDPGSRGQKAPNPGSRIRIRNTAFYQ
jgi:hypothetical protein